MTKATQDSEATIEELLEQRTQYEEWLAKLDASGDKAPPAVRQRVRGDYEARLQNSCGIVAPRYPRSWSGTMLRRRSSTGSAGPPRRHWPKRKFATRWESIPKTSGADSARKAARRLNNFGTSCVPWEARSIG